MKHLKIQSMFVVFLTLFIFQGNLFAAPPRAMVAKAMPAPSGPKKLVAVNNFENKAGFWANWDLGNGMREMLATSLVSSGQFIVLERQEIQDVIQEQDFGVSGRTAEGKQAAIGKILKSQIMISGAVTEFEEKAGGSGGGFRFEGFTIGSNKSYAHVAVNIRIYDTTTGEVLDSRRCEGYAESGGLAISYSESQFGFGGSNFHKTPVGKACHMAIDKAVGFIAAKLASIPWEGTIIKATETGTVYINAGSKTGILIGDVFNVFSKGEELIDPDTGMNLGSEKTLVGKVQVSKVQEKFSIAIPISGGGFERENVVRYEGTGTGS